MYSAITKWIQAKRFFHYTVAVRLSPSLFIFKTFFFCVVLRQISTSLNPFVNTAGTSSYEWTYFFHGHDVIVRRKYTLGLVT